MSHQLVVVLIMPQVLPCPQHLTPFPFKRYSQFLCYPLFRVSLLELLCTVLLPVCFVVIGHTVTLVRMIRLATMLNMNGY